MFILKTVGWFLLLSIGTVIVYNLPASLVISWWSKARGDYVVQYDAMSGVLVVGGILVTLLATVLLVGLLDADPDQAFWAFGIRSTVYLDVRY